MATKDKRVQTILQYLNPFECFEEVAQALRGLDYPVEMLLEWMHESEFTNSNGEYYTSRGRYDEREKITRFNSFMTLADRQEGDHVRGYSTLIQLWHNEGYSAIQLEDLADQLEDDDVEYSSGEGGKSTFTKRVKINKFYSYEKISVSPVELPVISLSESEQYKTYLTELFESEDNLYFSMDCYGGMLVNRNKAIDMGQGPVFMNVNPCTDNGNHNVTKFKYWLLEIDEDENKNPVSLEEQYAWMLASKLPITTITFSGGKSLHGLVCINAMDHESFRDRVEEVRDYCVQLGMPLDCRVIDPSRYTRVPGATAQMREYQSLVSWAVGPKDYDSWLVDRIYYLKSQEIEK